MEVISINQITNKTTFSQDLINFIKCKLCENVTLLPIKEHFCGILFCSNCLKEYWEINKIPNECPNKCERPIFKEIQGLEKEYILNQVDLICKNFRNGCKITLNYSKIKDLIHHQVNCLYKLIECEDCGQIITHKSYFKHKLFCDKLGIIRIGKEDELGETIVNLIEEKEFIIKTFSSQEKDLAIIEEDLKFLRKSAKLSQDIKELKSDFDFLKEEYHDIKKLIKDLNEIRFQIKLEDEYHERSINSLLSEMDYLKSRLENDTREVKLENSTLNRQLINIPKRIERILQEIHPSFQKELENIGQEILSIKPKIISSRKSSKNANRNSHDRNEHETNNNLLSNQQIRIDKEGNENVVQWEKHGKIYKHKDNYDYTIQTEFVMPNYFRASVRITPPENNNPWFAFGVTRTKVNVDNRKFMWCSESINDCYVYNCNGMVSDSEDSRKYGETYWQRTNLISIVLDRKNNISFEKNGENFGIAFKNVKGPFYLSASVMYKNYEVELVDIKEL